MTSLEFRERPAAWYQEMKARALAEPEPEPAPPSPPVRAGYRIGAARRAVLAERAAAGLRKGEWKVKQPCGTVAAYRRHLRAGERPCEPCAEANRAANRKPAAKPRELRPCGTQAAFSRHRRNGETPCYLCRQEHNRAERDRRRRKRQAARLEREAAGRADCCGAPLGGGERTAKYARRHWDEGTEPCPAACDARNAAERKVVAARKAADDVRERRRARRAARLAASTRGRR